MIECRWSYIHTVDSCCYTHIHTYVRTYLGVSRLPVLGHGGLLVLFHDGRTLHLGVSNAGHGPPQDTVAEQEVLKGSAHGETRAADANGLHHTWDRDGQWLQSGCTLR